MVLLPWLASLCVDSLDPEFGVRQTASVVSYLSSVGEPLGLNFEPSEANMGAVEYERRVQAGHIPTRACVHDWFNGVVWLSYPLAKNCISSLHLAEEASLTDSAPARLASGNARSRRRDALTLFDESGLVLVTRSRQISAQLRDHRWYEVFVENRCEWLNGVDLLVFGHGLLESLLRPHKGLCGKVLHMVLEESQWQTWRACSDNPRARASWLDVRLQSVIPKLTSPSELSPLPVMGVPGWFADNEDPSFYYDRRVFRQKPTRK